MTSHLRCGRAIWGGLTLAAGHNARRGRPPAGLHMTACACLSGRWSFEACRSGRAFLPSAGFAPGSALRYPKSCETTRESMMADQETVASIAKLTAEIHALSVITAELIAAECKKTPDANFRWRTLNGQAQRVLKQSLFSAGPDATEMLHWASHRADSIFLSAQRQLAQG
jgi:hypothetical protein